VGLAAAGAINQLAIDQLKELLNSVEDFNELAVCVTKLTLLQPQIDQRATSKRKNQERSSAKSKVSSL
jgi:hypothetical protein